MFLNDGDADVPQQFLKLRVRAQRVEARVDAQPEEVRFSQLESLPEPAESLFPFAEPQVDEGQAVGRDVAPRLQLPQLFEQRTRLLRFARDAEGVRQRLEDDGVAL